MNNLFPQILQLLVTAPGNLIFHIVLTFALMAGLQAVINQRHDGNRSVRQRYLLGFFVLIAGQVILFVSSALVWQKIADPQLFLPVLDRSITAISLLWIAWMWAFPLQNRTADTLNFILTLSLLIFGGISLAFWAQQVGVVNFDQTVIDKVWIGIDIVIGLSAIGSLFFKGQGSWGVGLGFFLVILAGALLQLLMGESNQNFNPIIRLAQLCVYPLLPSLARNLAFLPFRVNSVAIPGDSRGEPPSSSERQIINSRTALAWLKLAKPASTKEICPALIQAVGRSMTADLCFLIVAPDKQTAVLQFGYDLIREESLPGFAIDLKKIPQITNALQHSKPVRIPWSGKEIVTDLVSLAGVIGARETGHLLAAPVNLPQVVWSGILLVSPYSKYEWTKEDQSTLLSICEQASSLLSPAFSPAENHIVKKNNHPVYVASTSELEQVREEQKLLLAEIERLREDAKVNPHQIEVEPLLAAQEETREIILRLEADNQELREALQNDQTTVQTSKDYEKLQVELRTALDENVRAQALLLEANQTIKDLQEQPSRSILASGAKDGEAILNLIQKIRQPIFSILGYADLLSSEGKEQLSVTTKMYIDRVRTSINRMRTLLDEYNVSSFESSPVELAPQELNLNDILEQVLSNLSRQFQEKKISLQVDISESLPMVYADRDALHQILLHLLQNAGNATPPEGTIQINMKVDPSAQDRPYMMLQVTDEGGGIAVEDFGKVFNRNSIDQQGTIPGLGDNGLGLSITKTLVEAHGGRIWVDSVPGKTTTIILLLPLHANGANGTTQPA